MIMVVLFMDGCAINKVIDELSGAVGLTKKPKQEYLSDKPLVLFILDTSGSMKELDGGESKLYRAKASILDTINQIDKNRFNTSLITFGGGKANRIGMRLSCSSTIAVPPSNDFETIINKVKPIKAWGKTPLAQAIGLSENLVKGVKKKIVILLSDGIETCGGNPVTEARKLYQKYGVKINFQVIGYAVDSRTRRALQKISQIDTKWGYYDAKDVASLNRAIDKIMIENNIRDSSIWVNAHHFAFQFDTGSSDLKEEYIIKIGKMYEYLKHNQKRIIIVGHTDSIGSNSANMQLSIDRANIVRDNLIALGMDSNRISATGEGEMNPVSTNQTDKGRQQNRRVEIEILD